MQNLAILRDSEFETDSVKKDTLYLFKYDVKRNFFILTPKGWIDETSTAFNFLSIQQLKQK